MPRYGGRPKTCDTRITFRLSNELKHLLQRHSEEKNIGINTVIRDILTSFLQKHYEQSKNNSNE